MMPVAWPSTTITVGIVLRPNSTHAQQAPVHYPVLVMVLLNAFTTPLMLSATNVALPAIADDLGLSATQLSWVPMAYLMAAAMSVLIFGRLADNFGRKRIFLLGTLAVILSSVMAATSTDGEMLLLARFTQGVSAAMLYATQIAILTSVFPANQRGRVIGLVVSAIYIGLASGPLVGGYVIDTVGWRFSFLLQVPLALPVLYIGMVRIKQEWSAESRSRFDVRGAVSYSLAILMLCLAVTRIPGAESMALLLVGILAGLWFLHHSRTCADPIWDVRLFFSNRVFTFSCGASLIMYSATYAIVVLLSLYLQYLKGLSATSAGLLIMIQPLTMALLSPFIGRLSDRVEPRVLASAGMLLTASGLGLLAALTGNSSYTSLVAALLLTGAGFSLFSSPNVNAMMSAVPQEHYGSASGAVATTRLLGQLNSMVLVALALNLTMGGVLIDEHSLPQLEQGITLSFTIAALICLPGLLLSLGRGRIHSG